MSPFIVIHGCLRICFNDGRVSGFIFSIAETRSLASVQTRIKKTQKKLWTSPGFLSLVSRLKIAGQIKNDLQDFTEQNATVCQEYQESFLSLLFQVLFVCFISSTIEVILAQFYLVFYYLANQDLKVIFV